MKVGVVTEIKPGENRVALTPAGADILVNAGHDVLFQAGCGMGSGFTDEDYVSAGASSSADAAGVFEACEMVLKVKEPLAVEWPMMRQGQTLFTYYHLAADEKLTRACMETGSFCMAYETLEVGRTLPLLTPMSEVAGRMAIQAGAKILERHKGGSGILLGGVPGV